MKYEHIRQTISTGDIVFVSGTSLLSRLIRFFTNSKFSHVGIAFWMSDESTFKKRLMIAESNFGGTRIVNLSTYTSDRIYVYSGITKNEWESASDEILKSVGSIKYGYMDFVTIFIKENFGINIGNPKGEVCSEYVARVLSKYSKTMKDVGGPQSPQHLYESITRLGSTLIASTD